MIFEKELQIRFNNIAHLVTEDLIRQWFIKTQKLTLKDTRIEKPYRLLKFKPKFQNVLNSRARADLYYQENGKEDVVIEFKYHKKVDSSPTCKTTNMGEVFRDLNRLSTLDNKEKYFIYVFNQEMKEYYDKIVGRSNHATNSPIQILNVSSSAGGKTYAVNGDFDAEVKGYNEFYKNALSSFCSNQCNFGLLNYQIEMKQSQQIGNTDYYLIVVQVF